MLFGQQFGRCHQRHLPAGFDGLQRGERGKGRRIGGQRIAQFLREAVRDLPGHGELLGSSAGMQAVVDSIKRVAPTDSTVLIRGETGTGKELVARSIHQASERAERPLVLVNCAAIPANLIESEFFGHERGAFTGAVSKREGRFALANVGSDTAMVGRFTVAGGQIQFRITSRYSISTRQCQSLGQARTTTVGFRPMDSRTFAVSDGTLRRVS